MISSFKDPFINELLDEQQNLTAVDRFSKNMILTTLNFLRMFTQI